MANGLLNNQFYNSTLACTKRCSLCELEKPVAEFSLRKDKPRSECKRCAADYTSRYRAKHTEKCRQYNKDWGRKNLEKLRLKWVERKARNPDIILVWQNTSYKNWTAKNPGKAKERAAKWYMENTERAASRTRAYRENNRAKKNAGNIAREAAKIKAIPKWANKEAIQCHYELAAIKRRLTGKSWHVDHVVPLNSPIVCGLHTDYNLQVIGGRSNISKGNRWWPDMPETTNA